MVLQFTTIRGQERCERVKQASRCNENVPVGIPAKRARPLVIGAIVVRVQRLKIWDTVDVEMWAMRAGQ